MTFTELEMRLADLTLSQKNTARCSAFQWLIEQVRAKIDAQRYRAGIDEAVLRGWTAKTKALRGDARESWNATAK